MQQAKPLLKGFPEGPIHGKEYILVEDQRHYVLASGIKRQVSVWYDRTFFCSMQLSTDPMDADKLRIADEHEIVVRRKVNVKLRRFFPLVKAHLNRGELEIAEFTRPALIKVYDHPHLNIRTIPLILFTDGFGLYHTMAKSIMGIYLGIAAYKREDRLRQMNIIPVTLGPHGSNDEDVWKQIGAHMR
jgi:hypothetical protein